MGKIPVWNLERADEPTETVAIESKDGESFTFEIQASNSLRAALMVDRFHELVAKYIDGDDETPAVPFPPVGGRPVVVSRTVFHVAAALESANIGDDRYTAEEFVALSAVRPEVVNELFRHVQKLNKTSEGNAPEGNSAATTP